MAGLWKQFQMGGKMMWVILFWSMVTIGIIIERAIYLYGLSLIHISEPTRPY